MYMKKFIKDLQIGDVLASTGAKVISAPQSGLKTPTGKCEIGMEYPNGYRQLKIWNRNGQVLIVDPSN